MLKELETDTLSEVINQSPLVFVQFAASWCGNCRIMKPRFKAIAEENPNANFFIVDAEKFPQSRQLATVNNLPTFAVFKDGKLVNQIQTNKPAALKEFVQNEITSN